MNHWLPNYWLANYWQPNYWIGTLGDQLGGALTEAMQGWSRNVEAMQGSTGIEAMQGA